MRKLKAGEVILRCEACGERIPALPRQQVFHATCPKKSVRGSLPEYKKEGA